ncbi:MAG: tetratricopeptide repeat protein [Neoaquamicrobium sediminum]|uniref:tetratricopeptide repeat protein n=1 Tax=Neoaquamicrobium sediminum TaxID=1849104 RepID=UPI0040366978
MRLKTGRWIVAAGLAAGIATGNAWAAPETDETVSIKTLSGAYLAARVAETDNDLASAIAYYRRAISFDADNQTLQQSLMLGLISEGSFDEALPYAEKLKEVPEVERFSRLALAVDSIRGERYAEAETWLKLTLESDLDRLITGLMTAWAKLGAGDSAGALAFVDQLSGPEWYDLFIGYHRALIAERAGDMETARTAFEATQTNVSGGGAAPEVFLRSLEAYAGFLAREDENDKALEVLAKAEEFAPGRVTIQALREDIESGEQAAPLVPDAQAGAAEALLNLATALNRSGGESFVRLYLQYAVALRPDSDAILVQLAGIAEQQSNAEAAIANYEKVPASSPMRRIAELQLGLNLADLERFDEAEGHLKAALAEDENDMRAYLALGGVYARQEKYRDAANLYDQAVARMGEPTRAEWNIFYQRGIAYERLKEWDKAEPNFHKALELYPDQPQALNYLGYSWVDMNINLEEGLEMIQRAVELRPSDGYIVDSLGWAFYRLGRFEDAARELERAVGLMPADPILNDHLGDAYWRVGRKLEATFQWRHTLALEPDDEVKADAERKLAEGMQPFEQRADANDASEETLPANVVPLPDGADSNADEPPVETVAVGSTVHVVSPGQSLWSIAAELLGDGNRYIELLDLNPDLRGDPGRIVPGYRLNLPQPAN